MAMSMRIQTASAWWRAAFTALVMATLALTMAPRLHAAPSDDWSDTPAGQILGAVVGVRSVVPDDTRTAESLGTRRIGSGVLIDQSGLVLTIGYLMLEAVEAEVVLADGRTVSAKPLAYDHDSGFGLLRVADALNTRPIELGESAALEEGAQVLVVSGGQPARVLPATVTDRRPFAGYWEYLLEDAIFTFPPHPRYGGAALIGRDGRLLGIGSLLVRDIGGTNQGVPGNMFVPIDRLKPILADLMATGRRSEPPHPWLGLFAAEGEGRVFVTRIAGGGPAEEAGIKPGDIIIGVAGKRVADLADFLRKVWAQGNAGVVVPLDVLPMTSNGDLEIKRVQIRSGDRHDWLKLRAAD